MIDRDSFFRLFVLVIVVGLLAVGGVLMPETTFIVGIGILIIITGLFTVLETRMMRAVIYMLLTIILIALLFLAANSEIMFALELSVYGGGIAILFLFSAVLIENNDIPIDPKYLRWGGAIMVLFMANLMLLILSGVPSTVDGAIVMSDDGLGLVAEFSKFLWLKLAHTMPFVALLMLGSLLGSVRLALTDKEVLMENPKLEVA